MIDTRVDVSEALAALSRASRALADGGALDSILAQVAEAAVHGTGAEIAVVWLPERDGSLVARLVRASSSALAAEIEGLRASRSRRAMELVRGLLDADAVGLTVPLDADGGAGALGLARRAGPFDREATQRRDARGRPGLARDAAVRRRRRDRAGSVGGPLDVAGDALAAVADDEAAAARLARLAATASGAESARLWRLRAGELEIDGAYGPLEPDPNLKRVAQAILDEHRSIAVQRRPPEGRARDAPARRAAARRAAAPVRSRPRSGRGRPRPARELRSPRGSRAPRRPSGRVKPASSSSGAARCSPSWARRSLVSRSRTPSTRRSSGSGTCSAPTASPSISARTTAASPSPRVRASRGRTRRSPRSCSRIALASRQAGGVVEVDDASLDERLGPARAQVSRGGDRLRAGAAARRRRRADRPARRLPAPAAAAERQRARAPRRARRTARRGRPERSPARAGDGARPRARGGARLGAGSGEAAERAVQDLALVRAEPLARDDAWTCSRSRS